jgi:hypothetical protein
MIPTYLTRASVLPARNFLFFFLERRERNPGLKRLHRPFMAWHGMGDELDAGGVV